MKKLLPIICCIISICMGSCLTAYAENADHEEVYSEEDRIFVHIEDDILTVSQNNEPVQPENVEVSFEDQTLQLGEGIFVLSGSMEGQVAVKAGKKAETTLILDGFHIVNPQEAAISCTKTGALTVLLQEGSENSIQSGSETEINEECITLTEEASGGALYSKAPTVICGDGSLCVYGYINNGIQCTKNLTINSGNIQITAVNHGIKVKDTFCSEGGTITILAGKDGIKAEQEGTTAEETAEAGQTAQEAAEEPTEESAVVAAEEPAGTVIINDGTITIECYDDGIQALLDLTVNGGMLDLTVNGSYLIKGAYQKYRDQTFSGKGLKADGNLTVNGGTVIIKAYTDGLHAAGPVIVNEGVLSIHCGDDGIHSDKQIDINAGIINISNSYEGIEANQININDGTISLLAWDDGMNANGGRGFGGSRGGSSNTPTEMPNLNINGGDIYVNAYGDGVDSNGNLTVNGGKLVVDGPVDNWNGPLDSGMEMGGVLTVSGGLVFAGGASGMAETFSSKSEQRSFQAILGTSYKEGTEIRILSPKGEELFCHTPASGGNSIVFSCPELTADETYTICIGEDVYEITLTSVSTRSNLRKQKTE